MSNKRKREGATQKGHDGHMKPKKPGQANIGVIRALISDNLKSIVVAMVSGVIGAFGFWLTPLREVVAHKVYQENAAILLTTDSARVTEGGVIKLRITITPQSAIHVEKGVITVSYDKKLLRLRAGQSTFSSPLIEAPTVLQDGNAIEFLATAPGTAEIGVELQTRYGTYKTQDRVVIE